MSAACPDCTSVVLPCESCAQSTRGMLIAAFQAGRIEPPAWRSVSWRGLRVYVAADALRAPDPTTGQLLRMPVSYAEQVALYRDQNWVPPTYDLCVALYAQATTRPQYIGLVSTAADQQRMGTLGFTRRFNARLEAALQREPPVPFERRLVFGPWKLWILDHRLSVRGAVNHGFWDRGSKPPKPVQRVGAAHDASHWDYSQLAQPIQRWAHDEASGGVVDLLEVFSRDVPRHFLDPLRSPTP